ncbi:hypothetical protein BJY00DRAFT_268855 [Aspergillus carlsbadensis]|nr:hypothetical protein BJY00DRAFT_268855 [Aspergillus carlsbadensis]
MSWSVEGNIAFITLIATIPTCIVAIYTIFKRWGGCRLYHPPATTGCKLFFCIFTLMLLP